MSFTLQDVYDRTKSLGYGTTDQSDIIKWANMVRRQVWQFRRWRFRETTTTIATTANTATTTLPATASPDFIKLIPADSSTRFAPDWIDPDAYDRRLLMYQIEGSGPPQVYTFLASQIYWYPVPDAVYTYTAFYDQNVPSEWSALTDAFGFPDNFMDAILYGVLQLAALRNRDMPSAQLWQGMYQQELQHLATMDRDIERQSPVKARLGPEYFGLYDTNPFR